jgi:Flp pilus assembly protein TadG
MIFRARPRPFDSGIAKRWRARIYPRPDRHFYRNRSGVAAVEFAIVAPVFLLLLAGIITFGLYFAAATALQHVANEAARASVAGLDNAERASLAQARVSADIAAYGFIDASRVVTEAGPDTTRGSTFRVVVRYDTGSLFMMPLTRFAAEDFRWIERTAAIQYGGF